jgi:TPR repeat protein
MWSAHGKPFAHAQSVHACPAPPLRPLRRPGGRATLLQLPLGPPPAQCRHFLLARPLYLISAVAGNDRAQHNLATMHMEGEGGPYNPTAAAYWYARAARQGSDLSAASLGEMYLEGVGVDADPRRPSPCWSRPRARAMRIPSSCWASCTPGHRRGAEEWREGPRLVSARCGTQFPAAQYGLAKLLASGELVPRNLPQAEFWYLKAARRGHAQAQLELGLLYMNQRGSAGASRARTFG